MTAGLERQLAVLARRLEVDARPTLVDDVMARIDDVAPVEPSVGHRRLLAIAAAVVVLAVAVWAIPGSRHAVAHWFGIGETRIERTPTTPTVPAITTTVVLPPTSVPTSSRSTVATSETATSSTTTSADVSTSASSAPVDLGLGSAVTPAQAVARTGLGVPGSPLLGEPAAVFVINPPATGQVVVSFPASASLPRSSVTNVGALLAAWPATVEQGLFLKTAGPDTTVTTVQFVTTSGSTVEAIWLSGAPHAYAFLDQDQNFVTDTLRLATNTLLWQDGTISYRLEADISEAAAVAIAATVTLTPSAAP